MGPWGRIPSKVFCRANFRTALRSRAWTPYGSFREVSYPPRPRSQQPSPSPRPSPSRPSACWASAGVGESGRSISARSIPSRLATPGGFLRAQYARLLKPAGRGWRSETFHCWLSPSYTRGCPHLRLIDPCAANEPPPQSVFGGRKRIAGGGTGSLGAQVSIKCITHI